MTFFDIKVASFGIKVANCKKRAEKNTRTHQASELDFWKNLAGEEVPPPPVVGGGMVRAFGVKKGNKGGGECLPSPETVRCRPCFPFCRDGRPTIPPILIG